jgi:esterase/lipase
MRKRTKIALLVLCGLVGVWLLGDLTYSSIVARRIKNWEASVVRDRDGVEQGCGAYTIGSGETAVLLIHGINDSPYCYHRMAPRLAEEGFTCRVMRLPGFAQPIDRYARATKQQWLAAVKREIRALRQDHRRVAIVAHSLGGAVTIACLLEDPKAVDAVVLLAPAVDVSNLRSPLLSTRTWHEIGSHLLWFTKVTSSPFPNDCRDVAQGEYPGRTAFMPIAIAEQTFQLIDNNRGRAAEFKTPLMMVLAKDDQVIDWQAAERFYQQASVQDKLLYFAKESGHAIPVDFGWQDLTREIAAFLRR